MSKRLTRLSRTQFQDKFLMWSMATVVCLVVIATGIFVDPNAFFAIIPISLVGLLLSAHRVAGWIYDRRYRRF